MVRREGGHAISGAFVFLLLGVFAVFSTLLVLLCAQAYRNTVDQTGLHGEARIMQAFVRNTLRAEDAAGAIGVQDENGVTALTITESYGGDEYIRYIYCYDGVLRDLFIAASSEFRPEAGEEICAAADFRAVLEDGLLKAELTGTDGTLYTASIAQRSAQ